MRTTSVISTVAALVLTVGCGGCFQISVAPSCPDTLGIGASGEVRANEMTPGAIATYSWEVLPTQAGTFVDRSSANTFFEAQSAGEAVIRLTASDGLFQVVAECRTMIGGQPAVVVNLSVNPNPPVVDSVATLICTSVGSTPATSLTITQESGAAVSLTDTGNGTATFTPTEVGTLTFRCAGLNAGGDASAASTLTVTTAAASGGTGGGRPPRGGRR